MDATTFRDMMTRVRAGDGAAAAELVRAYEPEIRRLVRVRLRDPNVRRVVDSADICQSVLGAFFVRVAAGAYDLDDPSQLARLLAVMARNRLLDHANRAATRYTRTGDSAVWAEAAGAGETPSRLVADAELLAEARRRMRPDELAIADQRRDGMTWQAIAAAFGTTPDAPRQMLNRAVSRVCAELGIG